VLGLPKPALVPLAGAMCVPGAAAALQTTMGHRQDYWLVAKVEEDCWFCHKGSLDSNGALDNDEPFAAKDLNFEGYTT